MQWFSYLFLYAVLFTGVKSNPIEEEIQIHSEAFKSKLWPTNRTLTWKLDYGPLLYDSKETRQDIEQTSDDSRLGLSKSDDDDSIMSSSYQLIQPNEILSKQDLDSIQALYGKKKNTLAAARANRRARSATTKQTKNQKVTTEKDFKRGNEQQLIRFTFSDQVKIAKLLKELKRDDTLISFKNLSMIIDKAAGMLPTKVIPILQQLRDSYSTIRVAIKAGFTSTGDILSEFIIKSWGIMQQSMNQEDQKALANIGNQLNTFVIDQFDVFVESSRAVLVQIQSQLLLEATGGRVQNLLEQRNELETEFLRSSALLNNKSSERGINQKIIDLLELPTSLPHIGSANGKNQTIMDTLRLMRNVSSRFSVDYTMVKNEMKSIGNKLKENMQRCKNKLDKHRNSLLERGRSTSQMFQRFRNSHRGDMARNIQENHRNFMARPDFSVGATETFECNNIDQGKNNSHEHGTQVLSKLTGHLDAINKEMTAVTIRLKEQISDYRNKVQEYINRRIEQRTLFWIYSWKVRDVSASSSQKLVQENINRLIERKNLFQNIFQNQSIDDLVKSLSDGNGSLPYYKTKQIRLEQQYKVLKERYDQVSQKFYSVTGEIESIYRSTGTVNLDSMKVVDELCRAVQSGHESITSVYILMRVQLSAISADSDLLMPSVLDALKMLNMIDSYLDTRKIEKIKRTLALE